MAPYTVMLEEVSGQSVTTNCSALLHDAGASGGGAALVYTGKSAACAVLQSAIAAVDAKRIIPNFFTSLPLLSRAQRCVT
jgi:hypothetical protein